MKTRSKRKILVSYAATSLLILLISVIIGLAGNFGISVWNSAPWTSMEVMIIFKLMVISIANFFLHLFFYYGGFKTSPILKGLGIGSILGLALFLISFFGFNASQIESISIETLFSALGLRLIEYGAGGLATAAISVTPFHRWRILRVF